MIYTVTLNPALDYVMRLPQLRQGEVNRAHSEEIQLGGKGINVSRVLSELGEASTALGFIAGFTGDALQQGLRAMGLHTDFVRLKRGATRINVKLKAQGETDINATGPAVDETALAALLQKLDALGPGDMLVLAGSVPAAVPADIYKQILARLQPRGVPAVVDAEKELLAGALAYRPFLVKPNHLELGEMFGQRLQSEAEIRSCAARLQARGAQNVLVCFWMNTGAFTGRTPPAARCKILWARVMPWWPVFWRAGKGRAAMPARWNGALPPAAPRRFPAGLPPRGRFVRF